ncbi:hypothetical protein NQ317_003419 [Molorchus minor]|uniref:SAP domain-containing protein n=1 Tax=Molorchus minor TaxID=1323400 RepID=A0ABQ9JWF9_9CUCU|nr:hypothetical protein NQ317_003419 [Molorchus minor]
MSSMDPAKLKVADLRTELTARGLDSKGNKAVLVKRLKDALEKELMQGTLYTTLEKPEPANSETEASLTSNDKQETGENGEQAEEKGNSEESEDKPEEDIESKEQPGSSQPEGESEQKGEKRKRSTSSPERSQRRRSRSPIKEDEPTIDSDKVQLSWYDSDLHLQVDKESFLSAKPLTEGVFGYAWAGVRGTHGISTGKVCYEVKLVEELKWEDFTKHDSKGGRDRYRTDHRKNQKRDKDKKGSDKKSENTKTDNGEDKEEKPTEQEDKSTEEKDTKQEEVEAKEKDRRYGYEKPETTEEKPEKSEEQPMETDATEDTKTLEDTENESKQKNEKPEEDEEKKEVPSEPIPTHLFRIGWSLLTTGLQLGEEKYSYGYESSGKFVTDKQFTDYGTKFGAGDVIGAYLDINSENVVLRYSVNGELQPVALTVPRSDFSEENFALFPHVLSRNFAFEFNFGDKEEPWFPIHSELDEYVYLSKVEDKVPGPARPDNRGECEAIIMVGLPASGKTEWVRQHVTSNVEKRYTVIGNTFLLERMTVSGEPFKSKFKGRWSMLVDRLQKCLNKLIYTASLRRRNYIIDQTNVFPSAQRRKMRPFEGFKRHAVIVVVDDEEQARRQSLQEALDGKEVPDSTILEMKAAMSLPEKGEWLEEVTYAGLSEDEAKELVKKYNVAGKQAGYGSEKRFGRRDDRWQKGRNNYRGKYYRDRSYHDQRYDPRGPRQGGWSNQRPAGNWNRDRRDSRRPPARDWRGNGNDQVSRGNQGQGGNYNRNRSQSGNRGGWGNWVGQGWNQASYAGGSGYGGGQGNWGNNQWKYNQGGSGQGYGNYQNWNYYGQYSQNWSSQLPKGDTGIWAEMKSEVAPNITTFKLEVRNLLSTFIQHVTAENALVCGAQEKRASENWTILAPPWIFHVNDSSPGIYIELLNMFEYASQFEIVYMPETDVYREELSEQYSFETMMEDLDRNYADVFAGLWQQKQQI